MRQYERAEIEIMNLDDDESIATDVIAASGQGANKYNTPVTYPNNAYTDPHWTPCLG